MISALSFATHGISAGSVTTSFFEEFANSLLIEGQQVTEMTRRLAHEEHDNLSYN